MKKILLKYMLPGAVAILISTGCSKSFLHQNVAGQLDESLFYKNDADATLATTAVYNAMQYDYYTAWTSFYLVKTLLSDESNAAGSGPSDQPAYQTIDKFTFDSENPAVLGAWRLCYYTIFRANKVINFVKGDSPLQKRLVAEARTIRAHAYLDLAAYWGDVPLVLKDISASEYTTTGRSAKAAIYAQIEKDLQESIPALSPKSAYSAADKFRVSKGTAQAELGKALLYQGKNAEAAIQFAAVISSNEYSLAPTVADVFSKAGEFGSESVFEVSFTEKRNYDWGNFPWSYVPQSNIHVQLMGPRSDYYTKAPSDSLIGGWGFNSPKSKLYQAFVAAGDAERRKETVMSEAELKVAGGNWTSPTAYGYEGYFQRKYGTFSQQTAASGISELNYGTNWRLIRFADILLMAAEAYNKSANDPAARTELNKLRTKRGLPIITSSGTTLFEDIVKERQLELAFEGFRFIDLVRWGKAAAELGSLGFVAGKHELLPIPSQDVKTAGLQQNKNY